MTFPRRVLVASEPVHAHQPTPERSCEALMEGLAFTLRQPIAIDEVVPELQRVVGFGRTASTACRALIEELLVDLARMHSLHRCTGRPLELGEQLWTLAAEVATSKPRRDAAVRNVAILAWNRGWYTWTADGWHHAAASYRAAAANEAGGSAESELLQLAAGADRLAHGVARN